MKVALWSFLLSFLCWNLRPVWGDDIQGACTVEMSISEAIGPATLDFVQRGIKKAVTEHCSSLLVMINTPGGSLHSTRLIVKEILNSPIPVLCLVGPAGAHAGSAGAIILQACHVNGAMEATNIGAATPIMATGQDAAKDLRKKLINDTVSWLDGLTALRGRNKEFGREIITKAKAVSAKEAYKIGAIDALVSSKEAFLEFAKGREVKMDGQRLQKVEVGPLILFDQDIRYKTVAFLTDPQVAYLLLMASLGLLYFELTHPGIIAPGVAGGIGLIISMVSLHKLDVTWGGLMLILLGLLFMLAEAFVPSFGALGIGGIISFFMGSLFLFDESSGHQLPMELIAPTTLVLGILMIIVAYLAFQTRKVKKRGAYDSLIGQEGKVVSVNRGGQEGLMEVFGETWKFYSQTPVHKGDCVKVTGYKGLKLFVQKSAQQRSELCP